MAIVYCVFWLQLYPSSSTHLSPWPTHYTCMHALYFLLLRNKFNTKSHNISKFYFIIWIRRYKEIILCHLIHCISFYYEICSTQTLTIFQKFTLYKFDDIKKYSHVTSILNIYTTILTLYSSLFFFVYLCIVITQS